MDVVQAQQSNIASHAAKAVLQPESQVRRIEVSAATTSPEPAKKSSGYGLPCAKCHLYYPADLEICPTCHTSERVSPVSPKASPKLAQQQVEIVPDSAAVEKEREEFLRQFKSQLFSDHADITNGTATCCTRAEHRSGEPELAEVCKPCYDRVQERVDILEAALHLELKEATQIIYDAVWADPSDPSKTYQNAANALLTELRRRAGLTTLHSPFQPLAH